MKVQRPGRAAAVVGGLVAVGAATAMALAAGTASAAEQGRCTDNVNVRAEPSDTARIVAVCQRGTEVTIGQKRNGFVELTNLHGWAIEQYVSSGNSAPARTTPTTGADRRPAAPTTSPAAAPERRGSAPTTTPAAGHDRHPATPTGDARRPAPTTTARAGGLLG
ncbi:SH3 domain-containing protein [Pseudonocardia acidicola]|uniref:SH3 domain-containing protein n=1 Tax=Pseudonocardia acidicola TaxID=2724939 RepID=A0ABX1SIF1_9PSEU|nr:SH3 domain-containing protein [Pseudonocardia acidicola]NMI00040.1 SH3 domain-containing protein [Pseudonocardia acidicola]